MVDTDRILTEVTRSIVQNEGIENAEIKINDISSGGANYSSSLHFITVKAPKHEQLELFAKVANAGEQVRSAIGADYLYATEQVVYKELTKIYDRLQDQKDIPKKDRFLFPKFYGSNANRMEETVVLENLATKGYETYDRFKSFDWEYASVAVGELAKFHSLSYAFEEDDPMAFQRMVKDRKFWFYGSEEQFKLYKLTGENGLNTVSGEMRVRLERFLNKYLDTDPFLKLFTLNRRPVLVHGDYRVSNLLHKNQDGKIERLIPVDYQILHNGSPIADLMFFIFSGSDGDFRRNHYQQLVDHYYATFIDFLIKLGLNPDKVYPREHFEEDLKNKLPIGILIGATLLSLGLVDTESAPKMDEEATMDNFAVKTNELYRKRLSEMIDEFIQWGVL